MAQKTQPVSVLPASHWRSGDGDLSYELLPAHVQPNALAIASLLTEASTRLGTATGSSALDGYQTESAERVDAIVRAVCEAIIARDIRYAEPPAGWQRGQKVRTPAEVLEGRLGTCLDTTVTLAAALEQAGIHTTLWLVPGHIFLGYWRGERFSLDVPVETSPEFAINAVDLGLIKLVETVKLTGGDSASDFESVLDAPRVWLTDQDNIEAVVDVAVARQRVLPLPSRSIAPDGTVAVTIYQPAEQDTATYVSTGGGRHRDLEVVPPRVAQWKNALLDLSLRNRLINYTPTAGYSLAVPGRSIARLEDMVNGGTAISLLPSDQISAVEAARGVRYARDLGEQTRDALLADKKAVHIEVTGAAYTGRLRYLANKAKTVVEETGANNLYLAFGMLRWRAGDRDLRSPLILVPVTLETHSRGNAFRLKLDEAGSSTPNYCLLEKLRLQFGITIPGLANPAEDDAGIDLAAAFEATRLAILQAGLPFLVEESVDLAILQFSKFRLWKDLDENWEAFAGNPLVRHLIETPLEPFIDPVAARAEVDLDQLGALSPVPADSSQLDAVAEAVNDRTFVLEGPPGTGKSQTITNLLARALAEGKRVLFVAEKRAALEVVKKRLEAVGLGRLSLDLHDKGARATAVRQQIKQALELRVASDSAGFAAAVKTSATARGALDRYARRLHDENAAGFSLYSARGEELAGDQAITPLPIPETFVANTDFEQIDALRDVLAALPETADLARPRPDHPWGFLDAPDGQTLGAEAVYDAALAYDSALDAVLRTGMRADTIERAGVGGMRRFAQVAGAPRHPLAALDALGGADWRSYLTTLKERLKAAQTNLPTVLQEVRPEALHLDVQSLHAQAQAADQSSLFGRKKRRRAVSAQFAHTLVGGPDSLQPKRVSEVTAGLVAAEAASAELKAAVESVPVPIIDTGWHAWDPGAIDAVLAKLQWIDWLTAALRVDAADTINEELRSVYAETPMGAASVEYERLAEATAAFRSAARLDGCALLSTWAQDGFTARWIATAPARQLASGRAGLDRWLDYVRATAPIRTAGLDAACVGLLNGTTAADTAVLAFDRGLAVASIAERRDAAALADFDVESHNRTIERFTATASTLRSALPAVIPAGVLENRSFDAMSSGGQIGGLRRQLDRQRGGMSVRALMENYGDVITRIAPCTLISPESVARFFPARAGLFDIVVFDEASQIRVADAVGAMGRGRSVVVVGDSKQMPPTSFAEASIGGDDDAATETIGTVQDEESILTECVQARVPSKWLSWHYRSQDESLISFSNHHYYDDRLSSFPAPIAGGADDTAHGHGVSLIRVDGHFERSGKGKTLRTNRVEADAIVADILRRFAESPDESPSVGVVTFNSQQRDLIENLLRDSEEPRAAIALDEPDGLFVKNLENVQGDERDVILFSIAFSANERGVVPLNFGPLTRAGGERRLNVAITRARRQVVLYSSFDPSELRTHETASIGLKHLRVYLELAQRGVEAEAAGLARQAYMDRHREEIADELRMRGFAVSTDIGLSDFRVDISVAKPEDPTKPLVAILLDGSQWRSRRTVADRDGLPVEVLGNLMRWPAVERIWLPEWLRDREGVLARVSVTVDEAARPVSKSPTPSSSIEGGPASDADLGAGTGTALTSASDFEVDRPASGRDTSVDQLSPGALRSAPPATPRRHPAIEDFTPWKPTSHGTIAVLDDLPRSTAQRRVQAVVTDVIRAEAPISRARLAKLVAGAFGLERVAQARVSAILRCVPQQHVAAGDTEFFWPEGATPDTWMTVRSSPDNPARPVEAIPLEELANALRVAADQLAGGSESELKRAALALFGIKRLTAQVDDRMSAALGLAIESGRLGRGSGGLLVSGHPSDPPPLPSGGVASVVDSSRVAAHSADAARALDVTQAAGPNERPDSNRPTSGSGFAVIDFETTGLFSNGHDRIVEVAVVHVDRFGNVTGAWDTLVNPGRDIGATRIHGITAAAVVSAPTFAQIAPRLVELLSGRVIVAHNAKFDTGFLLAELNRLQYAPELQLSGLCTMQLAREFLPGSRRRLSDCCAAFDIELEGAHRASVDALATAKLLSAYMGLSDDLTYWHRLIDAAAEVGWPPMAVVEAEWVAREVADAEPPTFLERIGLRMPDHSGPDEHQEYLALLDRALLDRRLSAHERDGLVSLATDLGIGRDKALELHQVYFDDIVGIAWEDGVLTQAELADIVLVGGLLGIDAEHITAATDAKAASRGVAKPVRAATLPVTLRLMPGDQVVLTGEMSRPREEWIADLTARGLVVWPSVTKKVRLVVAADPDSLSGKARKARDYGITIVDEAGLVALLAK